jgi:hypothetical protein
MTYDPTKDEPKYTEREMEEIVTEAIREAISECRVAFRELLKEIAIDQLVDLPLSVHGRWQRDKVYDPQSLVFLSGRQWISTVQTASEPSESNAAWRLVHYPRIKDTGADQ